MLVNNIRQVTGKTWIRSDTHPTYFRFDGLQDHPIHFKIVRSTLILVCTRVSILMCANL